MDAAVALEWVERLGGWAVVLIVVRWLIRRQDLLITSLQESVHATNVFREEDRRSHEGMIGTQEQILHALERVCRSKD